MKVFLCITSRNDAVLNVSETLKGMGHDVQVHSLDTYQQQCTYLAKKIDKLGFYGARDKYKEDWLRSFTMALYTEKPDVCLFINAEIELLSNDDIQYISDICVQEEIRNIIWTVDPVDGDSDTIMQLGFFDNVYVYEKQDVAALAQRGIKAEYMPMGYQSVYESEMEIVPQLDVCFVGSPYKNRLKILAAVAQRCWEKGWRLKIAGPFWPRWNIIKKIIFKLKYPHMYSFIDNGNFTSAEVSRIYKQAKICLNIHTDGAVGLNPRTFDIMATGAFELVDKRVDYDQVVPQKDLVVYNDIAELLTLIEYYIDNEEQRKLIAANGQQCARKWYSMQMALRKILES